MASLAAGVAEGSYLSRGFEGMVIPEIRHQRMTAHSIADGTDLIITASSSRTPAGDPLPNGQVSLIRAAADGHPSLPTVGPAGQPDPCPPWNPLDKPLKNKPGPLTPDLPFKAPFHPPGVPELPIGTGTRPVPFQVRFGDVCDNPAEADCRLWTWAQVANSLPRNTFRKFDVKSGVGTQGNRIRRAWAQAASMVDIADRWVRWIMDQADVDRRFYWQNLFETRPLFFIDPRPATWLGPYSWDKLVKLRDVVRAMHDVMYHNKGKYSRLTVTIKDKAVGDFCGTTTVEYMRVCNNFFIRAGVNSLDPVRAFLNARDPCWQQRFLMHECLHIANETISDWPYTAAVPRLDPAETGNFSDLDHGPCDTNRGQSENMWCYHGLCVQKMARETTYRCTHSNDNYAYLVRNLALHWTRRIVSNAQDWPAPRPRSLYDVYVNPSDWWWDVL